MTLFFDNSTANDPIRQQNIETLKSAGFVESGSYSRSGVLICVQQATKVLVTFGKKANIAGKRNKYFSLAKSFDTVEQAKEFAQNSGLVKK